MVVVGSSNVAAPDSPANVRASKRTKTSVDIAWDAVDDPYLSHYVIYRGTSADGDFSAVKNTGLLHYTDRHLEGETYYYYVTMVDKFAIESEASDVVNNTAAAPQPPSWVTIEQTSTHKLSIEWQDSLSPYKKRYHLYRSTDGTDYTLIDMPYANHFTDDVMTGGTKYYKIALEDKFEEISDFSEVASFTIDNPVAPTNLAIDRATGRAVTLIWDKIDDENLDGYKVYRSDDGGSTYKLIEISEDTEYVDKNLTPGTWHYKITAKDKFKQESDDSNVVSYVINDLLPYKDTVTVSTAGTPVVADVETTLGRKAIEGSIICLGPGKAQLEFSYDGTTYDNPMWLRPEDYYQISSKKDFMEVSKVRIDSDKDNTQVTLSVI